MIHRSSIVCLEMWKSDSLCAHRYSLPREVFIYISSGCKFLLILSEFKNSTFEIPAESHMFCQQLSSQ